MRGVVGVHLPELLPADSIFHDLPVALAAVLIKFLQQPAELPVSSSGAEIVDQNQVELPVQLGAVKEHLQLRAQLRAGIRLRLDGLVQALPQLRQDPVENPHHQIFFRPKVIERAAFAGPGA